MVYVKLQIWIWWKCLNINLSFNFPKSLFNFVNLLKFANLVNIERFIIRFCFIKEKVGMPASPQTCIYAEQVRIFNSRWKCGTGQVQVDLNKSEWPILSSILCTLLQVLLSLNFCIEVYSYLLVFFKYKHELSLQTKFNVTWHPVHLCMTFT